MRATQPLLDFQEFRKAIPECIEKKLLKEEKDPKDSERNIAFVEEVAAHLDEMEIGDVRIIPNSPDSLRSQNMKVMLNYRGWRLGTNYLCGKLLTDPLTGNSYPIKQRPFFFKKLKNKLGKYE